ncbi:MULTISPECIES: cellulose-binding domain-containing protein [Saccharothrix]|uniref:Cellulose binding domain-containing protein n=1 Tax=Saccharothrix texasensis TaxID=103734 RepID=A0A3N1GZ19_9PSEU|nr:MULTISPECIES: cellulose-binding domain-containing protein [Saccharothrix]ROP35429.1 cellulose binding domain-containing protein [Saccharothrix texasensis]
MRNLLAAVAAVVSIAGLVVIGGTSTAGAAPVCAVDYKLNQWATGFTANVTVTNQSAPVTSWKLTWTFAGNQAVSSGWSADVKQSGAVVTASNMPWNGSLGTGASAQFGFQATYSGTNATPTDFAFNGVSCSGDGPTTTTTTSTTTSTSTSTSTSTTTSTTTTTTTTGVPGDCGSATLCDGFEQQTGTSPSGRWTVGAPNCTGQGTVSIDNSVARSGSKSVRVNGAAGYCNHIFFGTPLSGSSVVHGRYYVRHTTALPMSHVTFMAMKDTADGGKDLRMGGQNAALQWNRESDDATLPEQSPVGVSKSKPLPTGQWNCVQFTVDPAGKLSTSLNGAVVEGLVADGVSTPDVDGQWLRKTNWRPAVTDLRLGWESYGEGSNTLWYDDVAIGSSPIAC